MSSDQTWMELRQFIVNQKKPFCMLNLYIRAEKQLGITDERLIDKVLNELYDEGVVEYREVIPPPKDPNAPKYAYYIV